MSDKTFADFLKEGTTADVTDISKTTKFQDGDKPENEMEPAVDKAKKISADMSNAENNKSKVIPEMEKPTMNEGAPKSFADFLKEGTSDDMQVAVKDISSTKGKFADGTNEEDMVDEENAIKLKQRDKAMNQENVKSKVIPEPTKPITESAKPCETCGK